MTGGSDDVLKEKAKQLLVRERELLAMRRKHERLSLWLTVAQQLAELVDPTLDLTEVCAQVSARIMATLDLHTVAFFQVEGSSLRTISRRGGTQTHDVVALDPAALALLERGQSAVTRDKCDDASRALSDAVLLYRFLWHRMTAGAAPILFVAGYDEERAAFYEPFDDEDLAHFGSTAHQLGLLIANSYLVRELKRDKEALLRFNEELERRVADRTAQLAALNGTLEGALESLREKDERITADIEEARVFQQKVLEEAPRSGPIEASTAYLPLERVGGDVLDVCELERGRFRVFMADATGHGVQAAMRTIVLKSEYDRLKLRPASPEAVLEELNTCLARLFPNGEILSTACCLDVAIDDEGARVVYANAGSPPIWLWSGGLPSQLHVDGPLLGFGNPTWPAPLVFRLMRGDLVLVATDGLTEQRNARGDVFEDAVKRTWLGADVSALDCVNGLVKALEAFRGDTPMADDVTLVGLRLA